MSGQLHLLIHSFTHAKLTDKPYTRYSGLRYTLLCIFIILSCQPAAKQERSAFHRLRIVATTGIIADAVRNVAGDSADVESLMQAGVDPHLYKATVRDIKLLTGADIVFYNGLHLEGKMQEVLQKAARFKTIVAVSDPIPRTHLTLLSPGGKVYDPHIWFDVQLWKLCVQQISQTLQQQDPTNTVYYQTNEARYQQQLDALDQYVHTQIASIPAPQRVLITAHDAFGYFGKSYQIEVKALQGISTMSEYGLRDVTSLVEFISTRKIKAIFIETSVPRKAIDAVVEGCQARAHPVTIGGSLYSDALGAKATGADTYIKMVEANVQTITKGLK